MKPRGLVEPSWHPLHHRRRRDRFTWNALLWALVSPRRRQRVTPTVSGLLLIAISFGIGTAAYNAANNILFITLSLLLACLVASGVLSWLNVRRLQLRLEAAPPMRVGADGVVVLSVRNGKRFLPTYGLWFELVAQVVEEDGLVRAETTFTARAAEVRAALAQAGKDQLTTRLPLPVRLDPGAETRMDWAFQPRGRGRLLVAVQGVGSLFPFGFLRKEFTTDLVAELLVWPAPVSYRNLGGVAARRSTGGERVARAGSGDDLLALRRYQVGDSHRLVHWKASARTRQLLVRQFAAESAEGVTLWLRTDESRWADAAQFELLLGFAASLAEDLFRAGRLSRVVLDANPPQAVRRQQDLAGWLDRLAAVPSFDAWQRRRSGLAPEHAAPPPVRGTSVIRFVADGPRGVAAIVDGGRVALA